MVALANIIFELATSVQDFRVTLPIYDGQVVLYRYPLLGIHLWKSDIHMDTYKFICISIWKSVFSIDCWTWTSLDPWMPIYS